MAEQVTTMVLKVDLQCPKCYRKVKKILCKYPHVRNQIYDEKKNTITITVCCSPEKNRDKLCYKGGKSIQSIEIISKEKPKEAGKPKEAEKPKDKEAEKPKAQDKPKEATKPKEAEKPKAQDKPKEGGKPKEEGEKPPKPKEEAAKPKADAPKNPEAVAKALEVEVQPAVAGYPTAAAAYTYYGPSYETYPMVPYYQGYGVPVVQPTAQHYMYDNYGNGYGHGHGYNGYERINRYDYFSEENTSGCSIM